MALQFLYTFLIIFVLTVLYANCFYEKGRDLGKVGGFFAVLGILSVLGIAISGICAVWGL